MQAPVLGLAAEICGPWTSARDLESKLAKRHPTPAKASVPASTQQIHSEPNPPVHRWPARRRLPIDTLFHTLRRLALAAPVDHQWMLSRALTSGLALKGAGGVVQPEHALNS